MATCKEHRLDQEVYETTLSAKPLSLAADDLVRAHPAVAIVDAVAAIQEVRARPAPQRVIAIPAIQIVRSRIAPENVIGGL